MREDDKVWRVKGETRKVGAIGAWQPFDVYIVAQSHDEAQTLVSKSFYEDGHEHVHIRDTVLCGAAFD